jgi:hypothetical protein
VIVERQPENKYHHRGAETRRLHGENSKREKAKATPTNKINPKPTTEPTRNIGGYI